MILYVISSVGKNLELANQLMAIGHELGGEHKLCNLVEYDLPLYSALAEEKGIPDAAKHLTEEVASADGIVYIAPEYNGNIPPVFNNAIAWISRSGGDDWRAAFNGKVAAIATFSGGGGLKVLDAMRSQLSFLGTTVLGRQLQTNFKKELNPESAKDVLSQLMGLIK